MTTASERIVKAKAKAFSGRGIRWYRFLIGADGIVRVWDSVAGQYTTCHSMSRATLARIAKMAN